MHVHLDRFGYVANNVNSGCCELSSRCCVVHGLSSRNEESHVL